MSRATVVIRGAEPSDAPALARLAHELGYAAGETEIRARVARLSGDPGHRLRVAERNGVVAGWIHASVIEGVLSSPWVEIRGLVVTRGARRCGLGSSLVADIESWARARRIAAVRVRSRVDRDAARAFYERLGYEVTKTQHVFRHELDSGETDR